MFERNDSVSLPSFFQAERQARIERRLVMNLAHRLPSLGMLSFLSI